VAGCEAVFLWQMTLDADDARARISPISHMTFDDDAKITSMRAFWSTGDAQAG
jgi:steroid delta-isomerase